MDQNCEQGNLGKTTRIQVPMKETPGREECNQCDYACSQPSALMTHLKRHSVEKSEQMQPM